ncbi:MAG: hypothetical protein GF333_04160 [Candidatus Omnitrophica bacterium]|nr:hypothetical protein [Candidatus Omnitrophota bacterium]
MRYLDSKFKRFWKQYLFQCGLATAAIALILLILEIFVHTAIIASLGATAFVIFTLPHLYPARPKVLVGGYVWGTLSGVLCAWGAQQISGSFAESYVLVLCGACAVGISSFLMVCANHEHPPAAGIALALVLNEWDIMTLAFIFAAVGVMLVLKEILKVHLVDLR